MSRRALVALACAPLLACTALQENLQRMNAQAQGGHAARRAGPPEINSDPLKGLKGTAKAWVGAKDCTVAERNAFELTGDDEYWFGRSVANRLLARYAPDRIYEPTSPAALYVNEVGQVAAAAANARHDPGTQSGTQPRRFPGEARLEDTPDRPLPTHGYLFFLVKDPAPSAFGLPGGFIILTDGLLRRTASEEELAAVLAHEIAHVQRGHGVELVKDMQCKQRASLAGQVSQELRNASGKDSAIAKLPLSKAAEVMDQLSGGLVNLVTGDGYGAPYEDEADAFGTRYLSAAGYPSLGIADLLTRVGSDPAFARGQSRSHPAPAERVAKVSSLVAAEHLEPQRAPAPPPRAKRFAAAVATAAAAPAPALHSQR